MPQNQLLGSNLSFTIASPVLNSKNFLLFDGGNNPVTPHPISEVSDFLNTLFEYGILIQQVYPQNKNFIYLIQQYENLTNYYNGSNLLKEEFGIGKIVKQSNKFYLEREKAFRYYEFGSYYLLNNDSSPKTFDDSGIYIVSPFVSNNLTDFFVYSNSVLYSNEYKAPSVADLPPSSVFGRLDKIQSLDKNELRSVLTDENIIDAVEQSSDNLTFLCQSLNLAATGARLSSPSIRISPVYNTTNRPTPQRGSIIYNDQTNRFEGYDGTAWRPFAWASGIGPPYT